MKRKGQRHVSRNDTTIPGTDSRETDRFDLGRFASNSVATSCLRPVAQPHQADTESWEHIGSKTCGKPCHLPSSADNRVTMELATAQDENPCVNRGFHLLCPPLAPDGTRDEKWRGPPGLTTGLTQSGKLTLAGKPNLSDSRPRALGRRRASTTLAARCNPYSSAIQRLFRFYESRSNPTRKQRELLNTNSRATVNWRPIFPPFETVRRESTTRPEILPSRARSNVVNVWVAS